MQILDNINQTVRSDLQVSIKKGSKVSIAAACFSIYAYQELKKQLDSIDELRFIFTSPTFIQEKIPKEKREFYIPRLNRERSLYGTDFEIKLRNELTQKAIAKECANWVRQKATFKSNVTQEQMMGFLTVNESTYMPINGFTTVDLGCERGNNAYYPVQKTESYENGRYFLKLFEELWNDEKKLQNVTEIVLDSISTAYRENSPDFIYFFTLYNIFNEFLEDISEDVLPNEATGFKQSKIWNLLYNFQKDAVLAIINKLEKYNGCILADSVGLGKTFTALAVIKYYENRNKSVLVLCPKKLSENWNTYKGNYINNPIAEDRLRYDVLYHTDLSREHGKSNGIDLDRLNWGNYDLVVIDESHNFRNGGEISGEDAKENRYLKLMNKVIRAGVRTKVLMLSATPVNNRFIDLKNQLALAYEGDSTQINEKLDTSTSIDEIFRRAQKAFNVWSRLPAEERTTDVLLKMLDFDFFEVLDSVTIARSRRHIEKYYDTFNDLITLAHFWEDVINQDKDRFSQRILRRLFVLNYAPNGMWTYVVSVFFMQNRDSEGLLDENQFYQFLSKITGFIWTYAVTNPGVNALRSPVYAEMVNIVNNQPVTFAGSKFEADKVQSMFANFTFNNSRPITKSMLAWWAFQDDAQELFPLETVLEIEHIYARNRYDKDKSLTDVKNLEALGNKALLEKRINIRAADYRFEDKVKYYQGFVNSRNQKKEGTRNHELRRLSETLTDFTEKDILERSEKIMAKFLDYLRENELLK